MDRSKLHRDLTTIKQFAQRYPAFSEGSIRWMIFNSNENGIEVALVRIGRRVLIDTNQFFLWVDAQSKKAQAA